MNNIWLLNIFFASIWWNNWNAFYDKIDILNSTNKTTNNLESIFIYFLKRTLTLLIKLHQLLLNLNSQPLRIQYFLNLSNQFLRLPIQLLQLLIPSLLSLASAGYQLPLNLEEFLQLYDDCQLKLKWVYISISILKHYKMDYKSQIIND